MPNGVNFLWADFRVESFGIRLLTENWIKQRPQRVRSLEFKPQFVPYDSQSKD